MSREFCLFLVKVKEEREARGLCDTVATDVAVHIAVLYRYRSSLCTYIVNCAGALEPIWLGEPQDVAVEGLHVVAGFTQE